jgi:hypothetical protein
VGGEHDLGALAAGHLGELGDEVQLGGERQPGLGSSMTNKPSPRNRRVPSSDTNDSPCDIVVEGRVARPGLVSSQVNSPCIVSARTK